MWIQVLPVFMLFYSELALKNWLQPVFGFCVADVERSRELGEREKGGGIPFPLSFRAFLPLILRFLRLPHRLNWFVVLSMDNNNSIFILCTKLDSLSRKYGWKASRAGAT